MQSGRHDVASSCPSISPDSSYQPKERALTPHGHGYTPEQGERLQQIHKRLVEARRELDALIGDAYLRPRANIVPVHFLDLASAVEKLRWAEKEWRELDKELAETGSSDQPSAREGEEADEEDPEGLLPELEPHGASRR